MCFLYTSNRHRGIRFAKCKLIYVKTDKIWVPEFIVQSNSSHKSDGMTCLIRTAWRVLLNRIKNWFSNQHMCTAFHQNRQDI